MVDRRDGRDGRRARWDDHRAQRRQELIGAAVQAVRQSGPDLSMSDLAAHAGLSKQVFYRYFSDKADLQRSVGQAVAETVVRRVTRTMDHEGPMRDRLAAGIDCYVGLVEGDRHLYDYVVAGGRGSMEDYASVIGTRLTQLLGAAMRVAGGDAGAAEPWAFGVVGMVRAATDRWLEHPTMTRGELVRYLTDLVAPALAAAVAPAAT